MLQRYLENGQKVGPGNFDDSNEFKISFTNHFLVSKIFMQRAQ